MPRDDLINIGNDVKSQCEETQRGATKKSAAKMDVCAKNIRKRIKGVVDVKKINSEEYEISIA